MRWLIGAAFTMSALTLIAGLTLAGEPRLVKISDNPAKVSITDKARSQADDIFKQRCATCHGDQGHGDGPASSNLMPRPVDFHSRTWQKSVSDDSLAKAIVYGGLAVGISGQMAANPDLEGQPAVVAALVEQIRKWGD
ncbi:MAG TPA: c-type cytochrome [Candidatus Binataceae bacterium]|nr:c-type cytochrome [Candidatus Binataceae bacterium]